MAAFVYYTPSFQKYDKTFPWYFYAMAVFIYGIHQVFVYSMFVSQMAFFAQVSDPKIGGTYMTLLNTLSNLGKIERIKSFFSIVCFFQVVTGFQHRFYIQLTI